MFWNFSKQTIMTRLVKMRRHGWGAWACQRLINKPVGLTSAPARLMSSETGRLQFSASIRITTGRWVASHHLLFCLVSLDVYLSLLLRPHRLYWHISFSLGYSLSRVRSTSAICMRALNVKWYGASGTGHHRKLTNLFYRLPPWLANISAGLFRASQNEEITG